MSRQIKRIEVCDRYGVCNRLGWKELPGNDLLPLETDTWCVGGDAGILAFFYYKNFLGIASGDDGHWNLLYFCDLAWIKELKETISAIEEAQS